MDMSLKIISYCVLQEAYGSLRDRLLPVSIFPFRDSEKGIDHLLMPGAKARIDLHGPQSSRDTTIMEIIYDAPNNILGMDFSFNNEFTFTPLSLPRRARKAIKEFKPVGVYYKGKEFRKPYETLIPMTTQS